MSGHQAYKFVAYLTTNKRSIILLFLVLCGIFISYCTINSHLHNLAICSYQKIAGALNYNGNVSLDFRGKYNKIPAPRKWTSVENYTTNNASIIENSRSSRMCMMAIPEMDYNRCMVKKLECSKQDKPGSHDILNIHSLSDFSCSHLMTLSGAPRGRLGNRLFQIASLIGLATTHGYTWVLNGEFLLPEIFNLTHHINFSLTNRNIQAETICCGFNKMFYQLNHSKNWSFSGFLQSWKYFSGAEEEVRRAFTFQKKYRDDAEQYLDNIRQPDVINVGVHVRRGDFATEHFLKLGYVIAPVSYITKAMKYFQDKFNRKVQFIFASDDKQWCMKNFAKNSTNATVHLSLFKHPASDMALMAACDHMIITSGTYGWWAGWLAGGITIYHDRFPKPGSWLEGQFSKAKNFSDYYPTHWIGMR